MINFLLSRETYSEVQQNAIKRSMNSFKILFKRSWAAARRSEKVFGEKNKKWLEATVQLPVVTSRPGRPSKSFSDCSERSKRHKTKEILKNANLDEINFAAQMKMREVGRRNASKVLEDINVSPQRVTKNRDAYFGSGLGKRRQLSPLQALSMFVEAGLTRKQYEIIRNCDKVLFSSYTALQKAIKDSYPEPNSYQIAPTSAEINLQDLLDHTTTRLMLTLEKQVQLLRETECNSLELVETGRRI